MIDCIMTTIEEMAVHSRLNVMKKHLFRLFAFVIYIQGSPLLSGLGGLRIIVFSTDKSKTANWTRRLCFMGGAREYFAREKSTRGWAQMVALALTRANDGYMIDDLGAAA